MSYTEIYAVNKNGDVEEYEDIQNAWRGAMAVWNILEERYLPPFRPSFLPDFVPDEKIEEHLGYKPRRCIGIDKEAMKEAMKEIWKLASNENVSEVDTIILCTTFDDVIVKKENIEKVINAFKEFEGDTSLKEQATILEKILEDDECIGVAWNQTSVNADTWDIYNEDDECLPYNINNNDEHWFLFSDLED